MLITDLNFGKKIYIIVLLQGLHHPVDQNFSESFVDLKPSRVKA